MQEVSTIQTLDGQTIFVRTVPARTRSNRCLLLVHGFGEHGGRYLHVSRMLSEQGWNVILADQRGHGHSSGVPTHARDFQHYVDDLERVRQAYCPEPARTAILGHSMGGLVAIRHAQRYAEACAAMVLISPLLRIAVRIPVWTWLAGRVLSVLQPRFRFPSRVHPADTTRSVERRSIHDPLVHRSVTAGGFFAMQRGVDAAWDAAEAVTVPLLVLQAGQDRVVDASVVHPWLQQVRSPDTTFRWYADHLHELLNEPDWPEQTHLVLQWLEHRIPLKPDHVMPAGFTHDRTLRHAA